MILTTDLWMQPQDTGGKGEKIRGLRSIPCGSLIFPRAKTQVFQGGGWVLKWG